MSSEDMFTNSEEVDNPDDMEVDTNEANTAESEGEKSDVIESEPSKGESETDLNNVLSDRTNVDNDETNEDNEGSPAKEGQEKLFRFPQGRIKNIMKLDPDVGMVNGEAIFLVNKAVEEFIQCLAVESYHYTTSSKKKTIMKEHVMTAIESVDELAFLDGAMDD